MRVRSFHKVLSAYAERDRTLPPGTGFLLVIGASLVLWMAIAGVVALV